MPIGLVSIPRPQRWDVPFSEDMTDGDVDRLLTIPPFSRMDQDSFPPTASLQGILRNDARIRRYQDGDIVVREGDYGDSAFFIISGAVCVLIESLPSGVLGRRVPQRKGVFGALTQLWKNHRAPEVRDLSSYGADSRVGTRYGEAGEARIFLQDLPTIIGTRKRYRVEEGEFFGEISALGRTPRTATVVADGEVQLLEIRWQGLRDLRRRAKELKEHIDALYRKRSLIVHLLETPMFRYLTEDQLAEVAEQTRFETYGDFDWYASYKTLAERSAAERLDHEPIIAEEGHYPNGLILIRSGFARVSKRFGDGHRTASYLGRGQVIGFQEITHNSWGGTQVSLQYSVRAVGYVDILLIPTWVVEKIVLPSVPKDLLPSLLSDAGQTMLFQGDYGSGAKAGTDMLEFLVEERFINGTATMLINLDRCTRCDDCVRACAATHDNNPRFIRHGKQFGRYMVANACMHCADPVCMIGCPTGAIHRDSLQGQVVINDATCIGCATCANSCPYNNIRMVDIRDKQGNFILDQQTNAPIVKATKCDLCVDQLGGPACQRACPHDALVRVDMQDSQSLANWLNR